MPSVDPRREMLAKLIADHGEQRAAELLDCTLSTLRDPRCRLSLVRIARATNKGRKV